MYPKNNENKTLTFTNTTNNIKNERWEITNMNGFTLGHVEYIDVWKKFHFVPNDSAKTGLGILCLTELSDFIKEKNQLLEAWLNGYRSM